MKPRTIYLPEDQVQNIDQRALDLGYNAFSKYAWSLIEADLQKAIGEGSIKQDRAMTLQEQHDNMISEMARIGQSLGAKYDVIQNIIRNILKLKPKSEKDVEQVMKSVWSHVSKHNGLIEFEGKRHGIEKKDIEQYQKLGVMHFQAKALRERLLNEPGMQQDHSQTEKHGEYIQYEEPQITAMASAVTQ